MFHTVITSTGDPTRAVVDRISTAASTDPGTTIGAVIALVVLLVAAAIALFIWLRMRASEKARIAAMSPAERERHEAQLEYRTRVAAAEKALDAATKERSARLKASEKALAQAQAVGVQRVASFRGKDGTASITATDITVPQGTFPLTTSVSVTVDTAGNLATSSRSTLTRVGAGALLFGPVGAIVGASAKKTRMHDTRELYLLVTGEAFATLITCDPDDGPRVRQFGAAVRQAALNADAVRAGRAQAIEQATKALAQEHLNTAAVDAARTSLNQAIADTGRLDAATRALAIEQSPARRLD